MRVKFEYKTDTPSFEIQTTQRDENDKSFKFPAVALRVEGKTGRSRKEAMIDYMVSMEHELRELVNTHDTDIKKVTFSDEKVYGYLNELDLDKSSVNDNTEKSGLFNNQMEVTYYNFSSDYFIEKCLFTNPDIDVEKIKNDTSKKVLTVQGKAINGNALQGTEPAIKDKNTFIATLSCILKMYLPDYKLRFEDGELVYYYKNAKLKNIDDIRDDSVFLFFKFVEFMLMKRNHFSVISIDASVISMPALNALFNLIVVVVKGGGVIFIYNVSENFKNKFAFNEFIDFIELPNHKLSVEVKEKLAKK